LIDPTGVVTFDGQFTLSGAGNLLLTSKKH